jgi:hypothetical protein
MTRNKAVSHRDGPEAPPYLSYRTFTGFIDRLRRGIPNRIDRSVMSSLSGSNQSQLMAALRYMELISPTGVPGERLTGLVHSEGAEFQKALREILMASYPFLFEGFDLRRATADELTRAFANAGASGDTVRKCVSFFLTAAKHADLQVSPFTLSRRRVRRANTGSGAPAKLRRTTEARGVEPPETRAWHEMILAKFPEFDPAWPPEIKSKWFDAFAKLIEWANSEAQS